MFEKLNKLNNISLYTVQQTSKVSRTIVGFKVSIQPTGFLWFWNLQVKSTNCKYLYSILQINLNKISINQTYVNLKILITYG